MQRLIVGLLLGSLIIIESALAMVYLGPIVVCASIVFAATLFAFFFSLGSGAKMQPSGKRDCECADGCCDFTEAECDAVARIRKQGYEMDIAERQRREVVMDEEGNIFYKE